MDFSVQRPTLLSVLQVGARFISLRPQLSILSSFLLEVKENNIATVTATDLQIGIKISFPVITKEVGRIVIPAKLVTEVIATSQSSEIKCSVSNSRFIIKTTNSTSQFPTSPPDEYPIFPLSEGDIVTLPTLVFQEIDKLVNFATSKDETRPMLTGVLLHMGEKIEAAATDGYRLSLLQFPVATQKPNTILFPSRAIQEIAKLFEKTNQDKLSFSYSNELKQAFFRFEDRELVVRTLDGKFPPYQKIIPQDFKVSIAFDRGELEHQVKTALLFNRDNSSVLKLSFNDNVCLISSSSNQAGEYEASLNIAQKVSPSTQIAFNGKFLLDFLQRVPVKDILFHMNDEMKPGVFTVEGKDTYKYVVMPFRFNS